MSPLTSTSRSRGAETQNERKMDQDTLRSKKEKLIGRMEELDSLLVAFSGGVDSAFLLALSHQILGDRVLAVTADSAIFPSREREEAMRFTHEKGIEHIVFPSDQIRLPELMENNPDRCYHCKKFLSKILLKVAEERGIKHVAHGANADDLKDYRPGLKAAQEMGIMAPLLEAELNKEEIRFLSKEMGLETWDKPPKACLASRIPYGEPITKEKLFMVGEAEEFLERNGFLQSRVRYHEDVARIEVEPSDMPGLLDPGMRTLVVERFRAIGFLHIAVDLEGYVTGSMNRALHLEK